MASRCCGSSIVAVTLQTIFNTEVMRYTLATGEPVFTGFMRTRPSSTLWAWVYAALYFLQVGWPAWAGTAAGRDLLSVRAAPGGRRRRAAIYGIGVAAFLGCVAILTVGRRIERTLEMLNWVLVVTILGGFFDARAALRARARWLEAAAGVGGFDLDSRRVRPVAGGRRFLSPRCARRVLGLRRRGEHRARPTGRAIAATAWASGPGTSRAAVGGERGHVAHTGFMFAADAAIDGSLARMVAHRRAPINGVCSGSAPLLGMLLPALLYVTFLPRGTEHSGSWHQRGAGVGDRDRDRARCSAASIAFLGAWLLFKTQLDNLEGHGSRDHRHSLDREPPRARLARWRRARRVLLGAGGARRLGAHRACGSRSRSCFCSSARMWPAPIFVIAAPHLLYINTRLLPPHVRPPMWRRVALVVMTLFYGFFVALSFGSLFVSNPAKLDLRIADDFTQSDPRLHHRASVADPIARKARNPNP